MKISLNELKKYVDISDLTPEEIGDKLTFAGVEVEEIHRFATGTNLVIGQIIKIENHPDSDHLHVCMVNLGSRYGIKQIVCGAPNARLNLKVIVAMVGAKLANDIIIKDSTIRGVESHGMLCSLAELGVEKKYLKDEQINGIEEVDESIEVGREDVLSLLGIDDVILELKPLANRSDCNALINVAREVSCLFNKEFKNINYDKIEANLEDDLKVDSLTEKCPKFYARVVKNIKVKESPVWLKSVLNSMGVRSINNVVDIGNYVMMVLGQPLHMYSYNALEKKELVVKDDIETKFLALDNKEYDVIKGDICVTSNNKIECLAGIMGSLHSETENDSLDVVIESAIFDSKSIRHTSNRLGLVSESSQRFNKGINKFIQEEAIEFTSYLLKNLAEAQDFSQIIKFDKNIFEHIKIECEYSYINKRLSTNYTNEVIKQVLEKDFIRIEDESDDLFVAYIPDYRIDITGKADLSEEVIRILGFDDIKTELPEMKISLGKMSDFKYKKSLISEFLVENNFFEALTYTLTSKENFERFSLLNNDEPVIVMNELSEDRKYLRNNVLPSLIDCALYNLNRKNNNFKMFEISDVYTKNKHESHLSIILCGNNLYQGRLNQIQYSFYDLKGVVESIMTMLGIEPTRYDFARIEEENKVFHFGKSAYLIVDGKKIGILGELHPMLLKDYGFIKNSNILGLEITLDNIFNLKTGKIKAKQLSKFQPVERDISFIIEKKYTLKTLINDIRKIDKRISNVSIFDLYDGDKVAQDHVSIALKIEFLSFEETLKDEVINSIMDLIFKLLKDKYKANFGL